MIATQATLARRTERMGHSAIREILKLTQQPHVISFAGGLPPAALFPIAAMHAATERVYAQRGVAALQYSVTEGVPELRAWLADRASAAAGSAIPPEHVLVTTGSQQALDLYGRVLLDPGDVVAIEDPSYLGAIQAFDGYEARYATIATDELGMIPASLATVLAGPVRPKFVYACPSYQNPTGSELPAARRAEIVALCARAAVPLFEDDPYGEIYFDGPPPAPLLSYDATGGVTYSSTASKTVAPGLRVGWMVVPDARLRAALVSAKQGSDLHSSSLAQYLMLEFVADAAAFRTHLDATRACYRERAEAMVAALRAELAGELAFAAPRGGMFLWARTRRPELDVDALFDAAIAADVAFVPGRPFYANGDRHDGMRLNFSNSDPERIRTGVARLRAAVRELERRA